MIDFVSNLLCQYKVLDVEVLLINNEKSLSMTYTKRQDEVISYTSCNYALVLGLAAKSSIYAS